MTARSRALGSIGAFVVLATSLGACGEPAPLSTHVDDWRDEVVYQLLTDRFANGDPSNDTIDGIGPIEGDLSRFQGGDWRGVAEHLDYVEGLGASTIWISPIVDNVPRMDVGDGYHGYWARDATRLEAHFGSEDDLRSHA